MRLISLCPSLTELLHDLGAGDEVVGRTRFCVHPSPWVNGIESVGGTKNPKIGRIVALAPDVVFMNEEENRADDAAALRGAGIQVHSSMPRTALETAAMVRSIAVAIGRDDAGERIAADIEGRAARVAAAARALAPVRYAYFIWRDPWMSVSDDTFIAALLGLAGGCNVFAGAADRYPTVTPTMLRDAAPDVVFLSSEPFPFQGLHRNELAELTGLPRERFVLADGELLSWHGSRTPRGIDYAERLVQEVRPRLEPPSPG
jgi:iron complex transport system substrate-binding protein